MTESRPVPNYQLVDGFRIPGKFLADAFRSAVNFKPRPGDFIVDTFPKCGTTWTQQIVYLIFNRGISVSSMTEFMRRNPFLEMSGAEAVDLMGGPGPIKLHLPYHLTPMTPHAKYLYVVRNPKDTLVSFYYHTRSYYYDYQDGQFDDYFEIFLEGENDYEDYFDHVLGWYEHRNEPNVMFLTYEDLKKDTPGSVMKIARFMGENYANLLENETDVFNRVLECSSLEYMKFLNESPDALVEDASTVDEKLVPSGTRHLINQIKANRPKPDEVFNIVRKGKVAGWRDLFSEDQNRRMNEKIERKLKHTDLYEYWKNINCI